MTIMPPKIVIIYDKADGEDYIPNVINGLSEAFPVATIYTPPKPSALQQKLQTFFPKLRLAWFRKLDVSAFDVIISCGSDLTKHVKKMSSSQTHIHYGHAPTATSTLKKVDYEAAQAVDVFIATSTSAQQRFKTLYDKPSTVVHPPIDTSQFTPARHRDDYYVIIDTQTSESQIDLAAAAASKLGIKLKIFYPNGAGMALQGALDNAKGFLSLTAKDFDIKQVEALAAGAPIVAYQPDGKSDIVQDSESGILFHERTIEDIAKALQSAKNMTFLPGTLRRKAKRFDKGLFVTKIRKIIGDNY